MEKNIVENQRPNMNTELIVSLIMIIVTILGSTIPLHLHTSSQIDAIHQEMKDFHTKLAMQDQEFKTRLCAIEKERK